MIQVNHKALVMFLVVAMLLAVLMALVSTAGCITAAKNVGHELMKTPTPTPTPAPIPTTLPPTPRPTPEAIRTLAPHYVDPFDEGQRWEGQWFQWWRKDVQGINGEGTKDLNVGVIVYRHAFLDSYTWYNAAMGNYYVQEPPEGSRYFVVWVHEQMIGNTTEFDPSMWIFDEKDFTLQVKQQMIPWSIGEHNLVNRILEFDNYNDYYNTVRTGPFGYRIRFTGHAPETGGYEIEKQGWLRMGEGNAADGYLIYEVPKETMEEDILLIGSFATFGSAWWRFI